ncbi:hypothetical protein, partial [Bacillus sp. FJAT-27231]|uniref:hypothetical protein n=1 Tax=Bacillus sp. FJAT-27231 TaxID=1679168 RepID=UPI001E4A1B5F
TPLFCLMLVGAGQSSPLFLSSCASLPLEVISQSGCVAEERHSAILSYACRGRAVVSAFLCLAVGASAYGGFEFSAGVKERLPQKILQPPIALDEHLPLFFIVQL